MFKSYESIDSLSNHVYKLKKIHDYKGQNEEGNPIYQHTTPYPVIKYTGKVKLHGTNACISIIDGVVSFQKRSAILEGKADNAGFKAHFRGKENQLKELYKHLGNEVYIFGEWCGYSVQKNVACSQVEKFFCIFSVFAGGKYHDIEDVSIPELRIFNINSGKTYEVEIDMGNPELSEDYINNATNETEKECSFTKNVFGISGIGEGVVWYNDNIPCFKTKGLLHKISGKESRIKVEIPMFQESVDFVNSVVTTARVEQCLTELNLSPIKSNYGKIIPWVIGDILKEELITIDSNGFSLEVIKGKIPSCVIRILEKLALIK